MWIKSIYRGKGHQSKGEHMTEDEIMLMALDSGPLTQGPFKEWCKRFAALVALAEREACAKLCEAQGEYGDEQYAAAIRARGENT